MFPLCWTVAQAHGTQEASRAAGALFSYYSAKEGFCHETFAFQGLAASVFAFACSLPAKSLACDLAEESHCASGKAWRFVPSEESGGNAAESVPTGFLAGQRMKNFPIPVDKSPSVVVYSVPMKRENLGKMP